MRPLLAYSLAFLLATSSAAANDVVVTVKGGALTVKGDADANLLLLDGIGLGTDAIRITPSGGTTVTAGLPPPTHTFPLLQVNLVAEERTVKGSYIGTCVPVRDLPRYIALYRQGRLPVNRLMSGKLKLDDINEGFDRLHEGKAVRQVIAFA